MNNKNFFLLSFLLACASCFAQPPVTVGVQNANGTFTVTASNSAINAIFDHYQIMDDYDGNVFTITQDSTTLLYYVETTGIGTGPNIGTTIAMRVGISLSGNLFNWDFGGGLDSETCKGNPCSSCRFAVGGGCECTRNDGGAGGHCDHTISK